MSPALDNAMVKFNAIGFNHLIHKPGKRTRNEQMKRFALLPYAPRIVSDPNVSVVYRRAIRADLRVIQYWGLDKIIDDNRLRMVVRQVGNGSKHFFSIMERGTKNLA